MNEHGGDISVASRPPKGCTLHDRVPAGRGRCRPHHRSRASQRSTRRRHRHRQDLVHTPAGTTHLMPEGSAVGTWQLASSSPHQPSLSAPTAARTFSRAAQPKAPAKSPEGPSNSARRRRGSPASRKQASARGMWALRHPNPLRNRSARDVRCAARPARSRDARHHDAGMSGIEVCRAIRSSKRRAFMYSGCPPVRTSKTS